jgi:hypothetical protein
MGTPASVDELVNLVRAALQPDADAASKEKAQALLRELLTLVGGAVGSEQSQAAPPLTSPPAGVKDPLSAILERIWPLLAAETMRAAGRAVPFVPFGGR